jgi:hypothetical protein
MIQRRRELRESTRDEFLGLNIGFTKDGLAQLIGALPALDPAFERGADDQRSVDRLSDPPSLAWLSSFVSDRIDGVLLTTGRGRSSVVSYSNGLLGLLGSSIKVVYAEMANTRPGAQRGHEHFGFLDGISQPGVRGLTRKSNPIYRSDEGLPGQDLLWPGEFVFGYPGQHPEHPTKAGSAP